MKIKLKFTTPGSGLWKTVQRTLAIAVIGASIASCGGGSDDDGTDPVIIGTGYTGTAATDRMLADGSVQIRVNSGNKLNAAISSTGRFSATDAEATAGPTLSRIDLGNNEYLYGIGYPNNAGQVEHNIHSYSDVIIRSWFANQGLDIDTEYSKSGTIALPAQAQVDAITSRLLAVMSLVLEDYNLSNANLLTDVFNTDNTGIDNFLDSNPVIINNGVINIVINQNNGNAQGVALSDVPLNSDLAAADSQNPTTPTNVRALAASASEIVVVWDPSTDNAGVKAYKVFRNGVDIGMTAYPVYRDSGLATGTAFTYTIVAVDGADNESAASMAASAQTSGDADTTPPSSPLALATSSVTTSSVTVSWQHADISDVVAFELSRDGGLIASTSATFATDTGLAAGTNFCYTAVALDAAGNESAPSDQFCVDTGGTPVGPIIPTTTSNVLALSSATYQVLESSGSVSIPVNRTGNTGEASVDYTVTGGTAIDGQDFTATSGKLNWASGNTSPQVISVQIAADGVTETDETFTVSLSNPANATLGTPVMATVTISNTVEQACDTELETLVIREDTVLNLPCYKIAGTLDVRESAKLTIQPGVELRFTSGSSAIVRSGSALFAEGSPTQPILMTGVEKTPGYWDGIQFFFSESVNNSLKNVIIEYGGSSTNGDANLYINNSKVRLVDSTLRNSENLGFNVTDSSDDIEFTGNTVTANQIAGRVAPVAAGKISATNSFIGNTSDRIEVTQQNIDEVTLWADVGVPWYAQSLDVRAPFTIAAGNEVFFDSAAELIVRSDGTLTAEGTAANPILFTGSTQTPGWWDGLDFFFSPGIQNSLDHVTIDYAGSSQNGDASLYVRGSTTRFKANNLTLRNSAGDGFRLDNGAQVSAFGNITSTANVRAGLVSPDLAGSIGTGSNFTGNTNNLVSVSSGNVNIAQTWLNPGVPYSVDGMDIRADLKLSPGVNIQVLQSEGIIVRSDGSLNAVGTLAEPITFTGEVMIKGSWTGIEFFFSNDLKSVLDFTVVEYGGINNTEGNISANCSDPNIPAVTVSNSNIDNSAGWGIFIGNNCSVGIGPGVTYMGNTAGEINMP